MEIVGGDFESVKNMIYKLALERFNVNKKSRPDVEFEDVLSEAYCIYSMCLANYKNSKGMKFTTYLYQNLRARLRDYYLCTVKPIAHYEDFNLVGKDGSVTKYEETIVSPEYDIDNKELFKTAKEELSYEGFIVFKYIVRREWEVGRRRMFPTNSSLAKHFGYSEDIINSIMAELRQFWNKTGWLVA